MRVSSALKTHLQVKASPFMMPFWSFVKDLSTNSRVREFAHNRRNTYRFAMFRGSPDWDKWLEQHTKECCHD